MNGMNKCYIISGSCLHDEEADVKKYVTPGEARRMCRILKRAVYTSFEALRQSGIECPDAIITGTSMGCMENSEKFLTDICRNGEQLLKPTLFMQSTHNTIASMTGILLKCHGYNMTYSQGGVSFTSALLDAWLQIRAGEIDNALVGCHDELTDAIRKIRHAAHSEIALSDFREASAAFMLASEPLGDKPIEVEKVIILHRPSPRRLEEAIRALSSEGPLLSCCAEAEAEAESLSPLSVGAEAEAEAESLSPLSGCAEAEAEAESLLCASADAESVYSACRRLSPLPGEPKSALVVTRAGESVSLIKLTLASPCGC